MSVRLIDSLSTTEALAELFSDESVLREMLDFEAALARAEAGCGIIPQFAADAISTVALHGKFEGPMLSRETLRAGTPGIPLVAALTTEVRKRNPEAAGFVHWGATSQDVADTAQVLILKKAKPLLDSDIKRLTKGLREIGEKHAGSVMLGRTLLQAAPPITFGLKAAGWLGTIDRIHKQLSSAFEDILLLQFGGAAGTLASLGSRGMEVASALAEELGLGLPPAPWHTHRDRLAFFVCACGVLTASLGKIARDVSLLMQSEVGEVSEPVGNGRGGSSTMPHKQNPVACAIALAASNRVPGLVSSFLTGMVQEHERGLGGWQAEWPTIAAVVQATGVSLASMAETVEGLTVDASRMRANIQATGGSVFSEKAMMLLAPKLGRDAAQKLMEEASRRSIREKRQIAEILAEMPAAAKHLDPATLNDLNIPEKYLGAADEFRERLLNATTKK